jgi:ATP-dependent Clp protease ATP-binding subunit ClpB
MKKRGELGFKSAEKGKKSEEASVKERVMAALQEHFKPEFLNRIDETIMFHSLSEEQIEKIVDLQLEVIQKRLMDKKITLEINAAARKHLAEAGFNPDYGARPLKRLLQNEILDELALKIIEGKVHDGQTVHVSVEKGVIKLT